MSTAPSELRAPFWERGQTFWLMMAALVVIAYFVTPYPQIAMWLGFAIAARSAIGNDSIQTLGTFISSNQKRPWWLLAAFISGIMVATHLTSWYLHGGDIAFGRLQDIPEPGEIRLLQLIAPILLLVITRFGWPVSTTFFLLSVFSGNAAIGAMLQKSMLGYVLALAAGIFVWGALKLARIDGSPLSERGQRIWLGLQWISTSLLWIVWLNHDTANIAVFLPRRIDLVELLIALGTMTAVVWIVMYRGGDEVQRVVTEKSNTSDVRAATIIDLTYFAILTVFAEMSHVPMSTTWVFIGLLAGREFGIELLKGSRDESLYASSKRALIAVFPKTRRDVLKAGAALLVSLIVGYLVKLG